MNQDWAGLRPADKRHSTFLHYKHEFTEDKTGYIQLMQGVHENTSMPAPTGMAPGWGMTIFRENPYLPETIAQRMDTLGLASFPYNRGLDIEASYRKDMRIFGGDESIAVRFFANYLDEVSAQFVGVAPLNEAGELAYPEWLATGSFTYTNGPFRFNWQTRYRDATIREMLWRDGIDIADNTVSGRTYTNLNLSYDLDWGTATGQAYFYVGNLFDKDPPLVPGAVGATTGTAVFTDNNRFDTLGRTYSLGVRFEF